MMFPTESVRYTCTPEAYNLAKICLKRIGPSGHLVNILHDQTYVRYDQNYSGGKGTTAAENELFSEIVSIISNEVNRNTRVLEIGCGNGRLISLISNLSLNCFGIDPSYSGSDYRINPSQKLECLVENADLIIFRHVLEHISDPWRFLSLYIGKSPNKLFYIEVPSLDWIKESNAFFDIYYEHAHYFTMESLKDLFHDQSRSGTLYDGQYIWCLGTLRTNKVDYYINLLDESKNNLASDSTGSFRIRDSDAVDFYTELFPDIDVAALIHDLFFKDPSIRRAFYGAAAKAATLIWLGTHYYGYQNIKSAMPILIDDADHRQGKYLSGTDIPIMSFDTARIKNMIDEVLVTNPRYLAQIDQRAAVFGIRTRMAF